MSRRVFGRFINNLISIIVTGFLLLKLELQGVDVVTRNIEFRKSSLFNDLAFLVENKDVVGLG